MPSWKTFSHLCQNQALAVIFQLLKYVQSKQLLSYGISSSSATCNLFYLNLYAMCGGPLACLTSENSPVSSHMKSRQYIKWLYRLWMSTIIYDSKPFRGPGQNNCSLQGPTMTWRLLL